MATPARLQSVDILRGLVMVIMTLDHVRDFYTTGGPRPEDLGKATAALFLTRWITHFCAPTFMFTAGLGAYLGGSRKSRGELSRFLLTRGLWLMVLAVTVENFVVSFRPVPVMLITLWALGASMVALSGLVWLPMRLVAVLSVAVIAGHNLADSVQGVGLWNVLHRPGAFSIGGITVFAAYPLIPWFAVMAAGYAFGPMLEGPRSRLIALGLSVMAAFLVVRGLNLYGDPNPWMPGRAVLSFLNATKQPPSLDFLLMTLGPAIVVLGLVSHWHLPERHLLLVLGRVPLFYYLIHLCAIHLTSLWLAPHGVSLTAVWLIWPLVVLAMYPLCAWYAGIKRRRTDCWLGYL